MYGLYVRKIHLAGIAVRTQTHMAGPNTNCTIILERYVAILKTAKAIITSVGVYAIAISSIIQIQSYSL